MEKVFKTNMPIGQRLVASERVRQGIGSLHKKYSERTYSTEAMELYDVE